jgi:hypothetical protein
MNVGLIVANLPACRPILDSLITRLTSSGVISRDYSHGAAMSAAAGKTADKYVELEERGSAGLETTIYGKRDGDSGTWTMAIVKVRRGS